MTITTDITTDILNQANGWTIASDFTGRRGGRCVNARRVSKAGHVTAVAELREAVRWLGSGRGYRRPGAKHPSGYQPTGTWGAPHVRPCFAPGVVA